MPGPGIPNKCNDLINYRKKRPNKLQNPGQTEQVIKNVYVYNQPINTESAKYP